MNQLGSTKEQVENKLILLYLIEKLGVPAGNIHLIRLVLENKLMNYFLLQQCLNELCEGGFLSQATVEGRTFYKMTPAGKQALDFFTGHIPSGIRSIINSISVKAKDRIKSETHITADFIPENENKYTVRLKVDEDSFTLIDLVLAVGTRNDAKAICENWKNNSQKIYSEFIESLTRKRE